LRETHKFTEYQYSWVFFNVLLRNKLLIQSLVQPFFIHS